MRSINHTEAESTIIDLVDKLLIKAIVQEASDIHLEPMVDQLRVRMRLDGILYDQSPITAHQMFQVLSRIKVLSHMNIAEKRLPQDGTFSIKLNNKPIDFRISTFPTTWGGNACTSS